MPVEPDVKRAIVFIDGQNLHHHAQDAFGCTHPNYDPMALSRKICAEHDWLLRAVHFYTGVPSSEKDPFWHHFWSLKKLAMTRQAVKVFTRDLRYRDKEISLSDGASITVPVAEEKGIDVRLALDVVRCAREGEFDVAVILSQDQDFSEVAREVKAISRSEDRWIKVVSAFPFGPDATNRRGINGTDWFRMDRTFYEACIDETDYRPPR